MQTPALAAVFNSFEAKSKVYCWIGERPAAVDEYQTAYAIAQRVSLPQPECYPLTHDALQRLDRTQAAHVLAVAGTGSLAYDQNRPSDASFRVVANALTEFSENAVFFSNGTWEAGSSISWHPLTTATFDCGVIGFDEKLAFIYWVEDED